MNKQRGYLFRADITLITECVFALYRLCRFQRNERGRGWGTERTDGGDFLLPSPAVRDEAGICWVVCYSMLNKSNYSFQQLRREEGEYIILVLYCCLLTFQKTVRNARRKRYERPFTEFTQNQINKLVAYFNPILKECYKFAYEIRFLSAFLT